MLTYVDRHTVKLQSVLRLCSGFYRSKDPTNSIIVLKECRPVQVNHSPSFTTDSLLDREIKDVLLFDTLNLINFGAVDRRRCIEEDRRRVKERLFAKQQDKKELKYETFYCPCITLIVSASQM